MLAQCPSLGHLDLGSNSIGAGHRTFRFGATFAADDEASQNNKTRAGGVAVESAASFAPASSTGSDGSTLRSETPDLASHIARDHADVIRAALEQSVADCQPSDYDADVGKCLYTFLFFSR